jgi:hypothetical protein
MRNGKMDSQVERRVTWLFIVLMSLCQLLRSVVLVYFFDRILQFKALDTLFHTIHSLLVQKMIRRTTKSSKLPALTSYYRA